MDQWYVAQRGQQPRGPVSLEQLRQFVASGQVRADDVVWRVGTADWIAVANLPELASRASAAPPAGPKAPASRMPPVGQAVRAKAKDRTPAAGIPTKPVAAAEKTMAKAPGAQTGAFRTPASRGGALGRLPKPILFGLCGALGGLLGALVLGEALWLLLSPASPSSEPIRIALSPSVTVYPGGENQLSVKIARVGFDGGVRLELINPPEGLDSAGIVLGADSSEGEIRIKADRSMTAGSHDVEVRASAIDKADLSARTTTRVEVKSPPPVIVVAVSPSLTVFTGDRNRVPVRVMRQRFEGPVRIEQMGALPEVKVTPIEIAADAVDAEVEVAASARASAGEFDLKLSARGVTTPEASGEGVFKLKVDPVPPNLKIAVSKSVTVYAGERNQLRVKLARYRFEGPVRIELPSLPGDVTAPSVIVPPDRAEVEIEIAAGRDALPAGTPRSFTVPIKATAVGFKEASAAESFTLKVEPLPPGLHLAVSPRVPIYAGDRARFAVKIARSRCEGEVRVKLLDAPPYVSAPEIVIPADKSEGEMEIAVDNAALAEALPKEHGLRVEAKVADGRVLAAREKLDLEVVAPPSNLRLSVSSTVEVHQAGRCRFTVKIARTGFLGPVRLEFHDAPAGVAIAPVDVPDGVTEVLVDGLAEKSTKVGKKGMTVLAMGKARGGEKPLEGVGQFEIDVKPFDPSKKPPPLDILFVLDVTGSMGSEIKGVRDGIEKFVNELTRAKLASRIGLVAFRDITTDKTDPIKVLKFGDSPFTADFKAFREEVNNLKASGGGDTPESAYEALVEAANQPWRPQAVRILLLITDAPPQKVAPSIDGEACLKALKAKRIDQLHIVCNKADKMTYEALQKVSPGAYFELNNAARLGFAGLLPVLSKEIARLSIAKGPDAPLAMAPPPLPPVKEAPKLPEILVPKAPRADAAPTPPQADLPGSPPPEAVTNPRVLPAPPTPPVARVDSPPPAEAAALKAVASSAMFAESDALRLVLALGVWTAVIAAAIGLLLLLGQKLYLQQRLPGAGDIARAMGAGLAAGLIGGALSQWFFQSTSGGPAMDLLTRGAAWTILGGLLGTGIGLFVPNLRWHRGLAGGCIGGLLGAIGFSLVSVLAGSLLGRWFGAAILGFFIGLMIALAELAFRRYWLEIAFGAREIRTVTLGTATVAIGGDERLASVFVPGAPARALGYRLDGRKVMCLDFATGATTVVTPGDTRTLAGVRIAVRSAEPTEATGLRLTLQRGKTIALADGLPLTAEDIPGLTPQGSDGMVALVSPRPANPGVLLLRNRSGQVWTVIDETGNERTISPGLGLELTSPCSIDFGKSRGKIAL